MLVCNTPNLQNHPPNLQNQQAHSQQSQQGGKGTQSAKLNAHILLNFIFITFTWLIRVFEEGLEILEDELVTKKARLDELDSQMKEIMEERKRMLVEIQDVEKKKRLVKEIISWMCKVTM